MPDDDTQPNDRHWQYATRLWPNDETDQIDGAHMLARVPTEVGWLVVATAIEELAGIPDEYLTDEARAVLDLPAGEQVRACVRRIVVDRLAS